MTKKINKILIFSLMLILLVTSVTAYSVLSVSRSDFISDDPNIHGSGFLLTGINGIDGSNKILMDDMTSMNIETTRDLYIDITNEKYSCSYSFSDSQSNYVWSYYIHPELKWTQAGCKGLSLPANEIIYLAVAPSSFEKYRCVIAKRVYSLGFVEKPVESFNYEFTIGNGEETISSELITEKINEELTFVSAGKKYAIIKWDGNLIVPDYCPVSSSTVQRAIQVISENEFTIIPNNEYSEYKTNDESMIERIKAINVEAHQYTDELQKELDIINNVVTGFTKSNILIDTNGKSNTLVNEVNTGKKTIEMDRPFISPMFDLKVNSNFVGAVIPVGYPDIISHSPEIIGFKSGLGKYLTVVVKNVGDGDGTFKLESVCGDEIISTSDIKTIVSGDTREMKLFFNANVLRDTEEDCKITINDIQVPANKDYFTIKSHASSMSNMDDGILTCIGTTLKVSKDSAWVTKEECSQGCIKIDEMNAICDNGEKIITPGVLPDKNNLIVILVSLALTIFAIFPVSKLFKTKKILLSIISFIVIFFIIKTIAGVLI